jgi:hypothetical protein
MKIMAPPFVLSVVIITISCLIFVKPEPLSISDEKISLEPKRTVLYLALFALSIIIVFRVIPYWTGLLVVGLPIAFFDKDFLISKS